MIYGAIPTPRQKPKLPAPPRWCFFPSLLLRESPCRVVQLRAAGLCTDLLRGIGYIYVYIYVAHDVCVIIVSCSVWREREKKNRGRVVQEVEVQNNVWEFTLDALMEAVKSIYDTYYSLPGELPKSKPANECRCSRSIADEIVLLFREDRRILDCSTRLKCINMIIQLDYLCGERSETILRIGRVYTLEARPECLFGAFKVNFDTAEIK